MGFDEAYDQFIRHHLDLRRGERRRRLEEGHGHAEKMFLENVWWPAFGNFQHLHPEYEVSDFKDGFRYVDYAYIHRSFHACFEIDGYGPHWREVDRWQFADQLMRQNHLVIDDWKVIRFAYDDVKTKPRRCQQIVQQLIGRELAAATAEQEQDFSLAEREIIRLALMRGSGITPGDVGSHLQISNKWARKLLADLVVKKVFSPDGGTQRIRSYRLHSHVIGRFPFRP